MRQTRKIRLILGRRILDKTALFVHNDLFPSRLKFKPIHKEEPVHVLYK
jgi:hypothetical protein